MTDNARTTWIIGASSGVGRASALRLAGPKRHLTLTGRREAKLTELAREVAARGGSADVVPADVSDAGALRAVIASLTAGDGVVDEVLFCAGMNVPRRKWVDMQMPEFESVIATNLTAVAGAIAGVLPGMRSRGDGRVVVISSWAGWMYGRGAGVAYSASKTALRSLTDSLNDQEGPNGISACLLCPGDIDTPLIDNRPVVPSREQRDKMLTPDDVAQAVRFVLELPHHVAVNELVISPIESHSYGR